MVGMGEGQAARCSVEHHSHDDASCEASSDTSRSLANGMLTSVRLQRHSNSSPGSIRTILDNLLQSHFWCTQ